MTACATLALLAASITPAGAIFTGFPADSRPAAMPRMDTSPQRPVRPAARKGTAVAKTTTAAPNELNGKVKGPLHIIISLDKQELTLWSGGEVVARSRVSTGQRGHSTPTGVFSVIQKDRWHRSNLYDDAPMYYMQRITWSGVALHQGIVPNYPASHGCIRLPESFARQLWGVTQMGARVIIARDTVAPVEIAHPLLFVAKREPPVPMISQAQAVRAAEQAWSFAQLADSKPIAGMSMTDLTPTMPELESIPLPEAPKLNTRPLKPGPVSVFISRKEGKLFVRKGYEPVFDVPVQIDRPAEPLGTHVFTAMARADETNMRWTVVSMASTASDRPASAKSALDRITIPQEAIDRISELMSPGASLTISDHGLGSETGKGTDFIVLTR